MPITAQNARAVDRIYQALACVDLLTDQAHELHTLLNSALDLLNPPQLSACLCEHPSHFDGQSHTYGHPPAVTLVPSDHGPISLCQTCIDAGHTSPTEP